MITMEGYTKIVRNFVAESRGVETCTHQSCHEIQLTRTHASFVRSLWYFSSNSSAWRQGTMTTAGHLKTVLSSLLVLSVFFYTRARELCFRSQISCMWLAILRETRTSLPLGLTPLVDEKRKIHKNNSITLFVNQVLSLCREAWGAHILCLCIFLET